MKYRAGTSFQRYVGRATHRSGSFVIFLAAPSFFVDHRESSNVEAKVVGHQIPLPDIAILVTKDLTY